MVPGSKADPAALKDSPTFAGRVPYEALRDIILPSLTRSPAGIGDPRTQGHLRDGSEAQKPIVTGILGEGGTGPFKTGGTAMPSLAPLVPPRPIAVSPWPPPVLP